MARMSDNDRDIALELAIVKERLTFLEEQLAARKAVHDEEAAAQRQASRLRHEEKNGLAG